VSGDPIAAYLAELRAGLRTSPARTSEIVAEAEDHLRESAAAVRQAGHLSETAAQQAAIEAFGPVRRIVRAHRPPVTAFAAAIGFIGIAAVLLITMRQLSWQSWWVQLDFSGAAVAILASVGCVLWTAISLVHLALTSWRGTRERTPPEGTDIAIVG
jgi:hypothetical protein